jgi:hypothetical protein
VIKGIAIPCLILLFVPGCGRKGPPLPPIARTPVAPSDVSAVRRADRVELRFTVPAQNTDGSRPANITRIDLYALTSDGPLPSQQVIGLGKPVASLAVKGPRNPNDVIGPDDPDEDLEPLEGDGLDQGSRAILAEDLPAAERVAPDSPRLRVYALVAVSRNGRLGLVTQSFPVRLSAAPGPPGSPTATYTETSITVSWPASADPAVTYHVYEIAGSGTDAPPATSSERPGEVRLTTEAVREARFNDPRVEWGAERCYGVRTVETVDGLSVESGQSPVTCITLKDTFPPAPPSGFETGSSNGAISLIWEASKEKDVAGYHVLRGEPGAATLTRLTPTPIQETGYTDTVPSGSRYVYAVVAVDQANNVSEPSDRKEETAR